jgi:hypothetical protein
MLGSFTPIASDHKWMDGHSSLQDGDFVVPNCNVAIQVINAPHVLGVVGNPF